MNKIIRGIVNDMTGKEKVLAEERLAVCLTPEGATDTCGFYNGEYFLGARCDACGCILKYKSKSPNASCPKGKWKR